MRTEREEIVQACPHEGCECRMRRRVTDYKCDKCGIKISPEDWDGNFAHELQVGRDMGECVSFFRERDYCPSCMEPIWQAICELIGGDPDVEREESRER